MDDINIKKLKKEEILRRKNREKCFDKIKKMCLNKINITSQTGKTNVWFEIPSFIMGYSSYNIDNCCEYLIKKIQNRGFKTILFKPNILYIYWKFD